MRYAVVSTDQFFVYSAHGYDGSNWSTFKSSYESANPGKLLVDLGASSFPLGQGWTQDSDGIYPVNPYNKTDVLANLITAIQFRTGELEYGGTVTFKGHELPRDHDTRDDIVLLALSCMTSTSMATELLPLRVNAIDTEEVVISNVTEAEDFALAVLSPTKSIYAGQADQIAAIKAMTTITQLVQYVDPR